MAQLPRPSLLGITIPYINVLFVMVEFTGIGAGVPWYGAALSLENLPTADYHIVAQRAVQRADEPHHIGIGFAPSR